MFVVRFTRNPSCFSTLFARHAAVAVGLFAMVLGTEVCTPGAGDSPSRKDNGGGSGGNGGPAGAAGTTGGDNDTSSGDSAGNGRSGAGNSGRAGAAGASRAGGGGAGSGGGGKAGTAGSSSKGGTAGSSGGRSAGAAGSNADVEGGGSGSSGARSSNDDGGVLLAEDAGSPDASSSSTVGYALPPPNQGMNQFFIPGCQAGVATSPGGGNCTQGQNACEGTKQGAQVNFICPRFMLFSDEMTQAAHDDGLSGFNYAVVGHDLDTGGIDGNSSSNSCCQCYQLVFRLPENIAQVGSNGPSAIPMPPPLVVQSFNTAAGGGKNFDVFMGAGGFGAFNACDPNSSKKSDSGKYLYSQFPSEGEPGSGGVNAATQIAGCQSNNVVTTESLSSKTCQDNVAKACSKFASSSSAMTDESIRSCKQSNDPTSYYHMNWQVYAKRVRCPTRLMEVTGCKLQPEQGLAAVSSAVKTPEQAAADTSFKSGYTVTTMQDCCMPTCAWQNNVSGQNIPVTDKYNSFYSCNQDGVPMTESGTPSR